MKELTRNKVKEILETVKRGRYKNLDELKEVIKAYLRINLIDINKIKITLTDKDFTETDFINSDIDWFIIGTIENMENKEVFDFDLYYTKTRKEQYYIIEYICELIIRKLLENGTQIQEIYNSLIKKELVFYVWKNDISSIEKNKYEDEIKRLFPEQYKNYIIAMEKFKNRDYVDIENSMKKILEASNIFYVIDKMYNFVKDDKKYNMIISDTIMKNTFKQIINKINEYISILSKYKYYDKCQNKIKEKLENIEKKHLALVKLV